MGNSEAREAPADMMRKAQEFCEPLKKEYEQCMEGVDTTAKWKMQAPSDEEKKCGDIFVMYKRCVEAKMQTLLRAKNRE